MVELQVNSGDQKGDLYRLLISTKMNSMSIVSTECQNCKQTVKYDFGDEITDRLVIEDYYDTDQRTVNTNSVKGNLVNNLTHGLNVSFYNKSLTLNNLNVSALYDGDGFNEKV